MGTLIKLLSTIKYDMILAVISYPYHYHITQLTIKHALANVDGITDVKIIWDDSSILSPNNDYIPFSKIVSIPKYIKGWYAQQIVKLNLHRVINDEILIIDGDVIVNQQLNPKEFFYAPLMFEKSNLFSKVKSILGIDQFDFSCAPFMHVHTDWLHDLHDLNSNINEIYINTARTQWANNGFWPIPEWSLLYHFITEVKKINKQVLTFQYELLEKKDFEQSFNSLQNFVLNGKDNFTVDFYQKHNITINEILWKQIYGALV